MYPPSSNNCNYSPILSSLICQNIPASPFMQYEHELYFQSYHHDDQYNYLQQQQQVPSIEDLSVHILADSCTGTVAKPSNCTDNVIITSNHLIEGIGGGGGREGRSGNKGEDVMNSRISIIRGRISKNNKRSSNKDRHSKINTARGPRDRRMRLSLDAAREFFRLQDLLGFDKASKTVEWLLTKSESAIEELAAKGNEGAQLPHSSSTTTTTTGIGAICASNSISESCEIVSGTDETSSNDKNKETAKYHEKKKKKKKANTARRAMFEPLTRELRIQARARARERTNTKKMSQISKSKVPTHDLNPSRSRKPINKTCEEPGTVQEQLNFHQENNVDEYNLAVNGNWNASSIFSYHEQNAGISNEHQLVTDFQFCGKLWEG